VFYSNFLSDSFLLMYLLKYWKYG